MMLSKSALIIVIVLPIREIGFILFSFIDVVKDNSIHHVYLYDTSLIFGEVCQG